MQRVADLAPALFRASLDEVLRLFYLRGNSPCEWSALRLSLQTAGIKASDPNEWGALAASLKESGVLDKVGMRQAKAASRNSAKNGLYCLTAVWWDQACRMARSRGWQREQMAEQTVLVP